MTDANPMQALLTAMAGGAGGAPKAAEVSERLTEHLGADAERMEIVTQTIPSYQHANLQLALDAYLREPGRTHELLGVRGGESSGMLGITKPPELSELLGARASTARF